MKYTLLALLLFCMTAIGADETVVVYQLNGTLQCAEGEGIAAESAADLLRGQGVKVLSVERRTLPMEVSSHCGAPTGEANVIEVAAADWASFTTKNLDAGGYGLWVFEDTSVQVYQYDGTLQCGMGQEVSLDEMAAKLSGAGIEVLESRKGTDGLMHIAVCGASTGAINVYTIKREDLSSAGDLGLRMLVTRELTQRIKPPVARQTGMQGIQARSVGRPLTKAPDSIPVLW